MAYHLGTFGMLFPTYCDLGHANSNLACNLGWIACKLGGRHWVECNLGTPVYPEYNCNSVWMTQRQHKVCVRCEICLFMRLRHHSVWKYMWLFENVSIFLCLCVCACWVYCWLPWNVLWQRVDLQSLLTAFAHGLQIPLGLQPAFSSCLDTYTLTHKYKHTPLLINTAQDSARQATFTLSTSALQTAKR